jgi:hypothetical protein
MSRTSINSFDDITLSYVITAVAWCYLLQLLFSAVCLGAPSSSRGPWGAPLALTCALCICLLAVVWCYQQQLSSLLLLVATSSSCFSAVVWVPPATAGGALGCSPWLEALGCSPGPDMCSLHMSSAVVWCYQQQLFSLLLVGCYQQQLFLCCCLGTTSNSSGPRGAPLGLVSFSLCCWGVSLLLCVK